MAALSRPRASLSDGLHGILQRQLRAVTTLSAINRGLRESDPTRRPRDSSWQRERPERTFRLRRHASKPNDAMQSSFDRTLPFSSPPLERWRPDNQTRQPRSTDATTLHAVGIRTSSGGRTFSYRRAVSFRELTDYHPDFKDVAQKIDSGILTDDELLHALEQPMKKLKRGVQTIQRFQRGRKSRAPKDLPREAQLMKCQGLVNLLNVAVRAWRSKHEGENATLYIYKNAVQGPLSKFCLTDWPPVAGKTGRTSLLSLHLQGDYGFRLMDPGDEIDMKNLATFFSQESREAAEEARLSRALEDLPKASLHENDAEDAASVDADGPVAIPYTTAASVFLYGYHTVIAALKARRRKLYTLYYHPRLMSRDGLSIDEITSLASSLDVVLKDCTNDMPLLSKLSENRPHNGIVLEASRLPAPPIIGLRLPEPLTTTIPVHARKQNAEDRKIDGTQLDIPYLKDTWRHPFVVMLDGITDPANVGSIMRTAHFFGVDAVAVSTNTCANLASPILAKASSGACEAVRIFSLPKPSAFIWESAKAGWDIYAAVPPGRSMLESRGSYSNHINTEITPFISASTVSKFSPLATKPTILMLGAEDEGLRDILKARANFFVYIKHGQRTAFTPDVGVDSLNVSVAASVLIASFMRKPSVTSNSTWESQRRGFAGEQIYNRDSLRHQDASMRREEPMREFRRNLVRAV